MGEAGSIYTQGELDWQQVEMTLKLSFTMLRTLKDVAEYLVGRTRNREGITM